MKQKFVIRKIYKRISPSRSLSSPHSRLPHSICLSGLSVRNRCVHKVGGCSDFDAQSFVHFHFLLLVENIYIPCDATFVCQHTVYTHSTYISENHKTSLTYSQHGCHTYISTANYQLSIVVKVIAFWYRSHLTQR